MNCTDEASKVYPRREVIAEWKNGGTAGCSPVLSTRY